MGLTGSREGKKIIGLFFLPAFLFYLGHYPMARLRRRNARSKPSASHAARVDEEPPAGAKEQPSPGSPPLPPPLPELPWPELPWPELLELVLLPTWVQTPPAHTPPEHQQPSGFGGFEHPVTGSHVPTSWHSSLAVHVTAVPPAHAPFWHVS